MSIKKNQIELLIKNIPQELKDLNAWVCWRYENINGSDKPTKPPYNAKTGNKASVTDPSTWCSFNDAIKCLANGGDYCGVGLVFTDRDKYSIIDLDKAQGEILARQQKIAAEFDSYSEVSPSGYGLHIIVKGKVPTGKRKDCVEIYSNLRYATFTGNVYKNKPIADCQDKLTKLWEELGTEKNVIQSSINEDEKYTDEEIIEQCRNAINGEKFNRLYNGDWRSKYPSQSEADLALVNIIAYYTKNRNQIIRLFRSSGLGKRDKAKRKDYVNWMIEKAFDQTLPPIDFDLAKKEIEDKLAQTRKDGEANSTDVHKSVEHNASPLSSGVGASRPVAQRLEPSAHNGSVTGSNPVGPTNYEEENEIPVPPGLMGDIARYIYHSSPYRVQKVALSGAIGLMAGICGRAYNTHTDAGLNLYILLIAKTGVGKEAMTTGIDRLFNSIEMTVPASKDFRGPALIASGPAIIKAIHEKKCMFSTINEFETDLRVMSDPKSNPAERTKLKALLDLYTKSGKAGVIQSSIYSNKAENVGATFAPSFTILADATPNIYDVLDDNMITSGLLPRFVIVEYKGKREYENKQSIELPDDLRNQFSSLVENCLKISVQVPFNPVKVVCTPQAEKMLNEFSNYATDKINTSESNVIRALWGRAHLNLMKLSSLVAIGVNRWNPVIEVSYIEWAQKYFIEYGIDALSRKKERGELGNTNEVRRITMLKELIKEYLTVPLTAKTHDRHKPYQKYSIITHHYLSQRLQRCADFYKHPLGVTKAISQSIEALIDQGLLIKLKEEYFKKIDLPTINAYWLTDDSKLNEW